MLVHSLKARGISSGFCRCFDYNGPFSEAVKNGLQISSVHNIYLSLGVGIENLNDRHQTLNLHTSQLVDAWNDNGEKWYTEPKPEPNEYIKYHT